MSALPVMPLSGTGEGCWVGAGAMVGAGFLVAAGVVVELHAAISSVVSMPNAVIVLRTGSPLLCGPLRDAGMPLLNI